MKKISIIFPIYNEEKRLDKLFNKIHDLGYDGLYITNLTNIRYLTYLMATLMIK